MPTDKPCIIICANQAWNLVNFRAGLIRVLLARGYRIIAVAPPEPEMQARLADMGCEVIEAPIDASGLSPLKDVRTILALSAVIRQYRPDAWLSWTIKPNIYGSLAARFHSVPAFPNVSGLGTAFIRRSLLTLLAAWLYRLGFHRAHTVFFQNDTDQGHFLGNRLVKPAQARLLPGSGIDTDHFRSASAQRPAPRHFLMLSRLVADKGVREYVAAAREVRKVWPDARFRLVGPASVANRTAIPAKELQLWIDEGVVEYSGPMDDVREAIEQADFIVLPSYREGMSRVLLEAAAMGRPIVTTDVPGCRDIVEDGRNGFLCAPRSTVSLANALHRAADIDDETWSDMAQAGRERAVQNFSEERVNSLYLQALSDAGIRQPLTDAAKAKHRS